MASLSAPCKEMALSGSSHIEKASSKIYLRLDSLKAVMALEGLHTVGFLCIALESLPDIVITCTASYFLSFWPQAQLRGIKIPVYRGSSND